MYVLSYCKARTTHNASSGKCPLDAVMARIPAAMASDKFSSLPGRKLTVCHFKCCRENIARIVREFNNSIAHPNPICDNRICFACPRHSQIVGSQLVDRH